LAGDILAFINALFFDRMVSLAIMFMVYGKMRWKDFGWRGPSPGSTPEHDLLAPPPSPAYSQGSSGSGSGPGGPGSPPKTPPPPPLPQPAPASDSL
jgi:hypothetical protein